MSPERIDISKIGKKSGSTTTPSTLGGKKLGELWSTNKKVPVVHIDPPK